MKNDFGRLISCLRALARVLGEVCGKGVKRESIPLKTKDGLHYFLSFYDKKNSGLGEWAEC
jgi:hypothetical protein